MYAFGFKTWTYMSNLFILFLLDSELKLTEFIGLVVDSNFFSNYAQI